MKKIINCETGEVIERELTAEELAQQAIDEQAALQAQAAEQTRTAARRVIFDRLGLSEEEARLLLGGN